ncbi:MAG TPA: ABC transporter transmembrane domain-containing protein, partial [Myxococcota bacterium]|nr:ABC transporter transmembrane domain-containing protein [Myxococcota bacterium]
MSTLLRFTRRYMLRYLPSYAAGTLALMATSWLSVTVPFEVAAGVDAITAGAPPAEVQTHALRIAAMGAAIIVIRTLSRVLYFTPGRRVEADVKHDLFLAIVRHQPATLRAHPTGDLFSRLSNDINMVRVYAGFGTLTIANVVIAVVMAGGQMLRMAPDLAVWLLVPIAVAFATVQLLVRRLFVLMRRAQVEIAAISDDVLASIRGMATIQVFVAEPAFQARFDARNEAFQRTSVERSIVRAGLGPTLSLSTSINLFLLLAVGGPMVTRGQLTVGELVAFATLANYLTGPLRQSSFLISVAQQAQAALERVDVLLDAPPVRPDLPAPVAPPPGPPALQIRGLTWSYPGAEHPALVDVDVDVPAGGTLGVFGTTGAGKSTLLRLLARLDNPPPGAICDDGVDILRVDLDAWRRT